MKNSLLQDGVIRNLEIIGEATKRLDQQFRFKYPRVECKKIAGMRDKLVLDYMGVDLLAVWGVVAKVIPDMDTHRGYYRKRRRWRREAINTARPLEAEISTL